MADTESKTIELDSEYTTSTSDIRSKIVTEPFSGPTSSGNKSYEEVDIMSDYNWTIDTFVQTSGKTCDLPHCYAIEYQQLHNSAVTNFANSISAAVTAINNIDVG